MLEFYETRGGLEVVFLLDYDNFGCCLVHYAAIISWTNEHRLHIIMHVIRLGESCDLRMRRANACLRRLSPFSDEIPRERRSQAFNLSC